MTKKQKLSDLVARVQSGDKEATEQLVDRFMPIIKKYCRQLGYNDAGQDLILWILSAVKRYKPNTAWGREELEHYFSQNNDKNTAKYSKKGL
jgi:DNA-directed RNA polymerase specialized sigma subunit